MATSPTTTEKTMTVDECGISTPDPTDEEIYAFFQDIFEDNKGVIGITWKNYINVLNYLLRIESSIAEQKFKEFKQKTNLKRNIGDTLSFEFYKKNAQKLDTEYSRIERKHIVSEYQRPIPFKYALNMWLSIHH